MPKKIDFEHSYEEEAGMLKWRVKRVKDMRRALTDYFFSTTNALALFFFINLILLIIFWNSGETTERAILMLGVCSVKIGFETKKIFNHLKELDQ
jgi:hypothetical protein